MKYQSDVLTGEFVLYFIHFVSYMAFKTVPFKRDSWVAWGGLVGAGSRETRLEGFGATWAFRLIS